ncbi:uncharacterized protein J4E92_002095 [Alternaria infectoria]|uniref:uncharacterized protein n=1 Tax=Alternaria infectoria TaxID=45303 RepID=UPI002220AD8F|nr:uncharacterized protein J4E92_002095 [Alternaria infectoria]KAI4937365.1 hypothetical protein J4E92_002095 [Alternaria infectoria]
MASLLLRSASLSSHIDSDVWDMIFPDAKTKKHQNEAGETAQSTEGITAKDIDIRNWPFADRKKLESKYDQIKIVVDSELVTTMPKPLFRATSTKTSELTLNGTFILPETTDADATCGLIEYLEDVISNPAKPSPFILHLPMTISLDVCTAASALGMDKYVDNLYKECEDLLRTCIPSYATISVITTFRTHTRYFSRLFRILVTNLAIGLSNNTIPDEVGLEAYCMRNPILDKAIKRSHKRYGSLECRRIYWERKNGKWEWAVCKEMAEAQARIDWDSLYDGPARDRT